MTVKTPITITAGWLEGRLIRRARKPARCSNRRHGCNDIAPGDLYAEMEIDPYCAGGFGMSKLCMACAGEEANAAIAASQLRRETP